VDTGLVVYICASLDVACFGDLSGSATVCVENGSGNYKYEWFNSSNDSYGGNNAILMGVPAGTYYCKVTDNVSLKTKDSNYAIIDEPTAALLVTPNITDRNCNSDNTGAINLTLSGGTPIYSYAWIGPNGFTSPLEDISGLEAGTYACTITDANGCIISTGNLDVTEPTMMTIFLTITHVLCFGELTGSICVDVSGGNPPYTYQWDDPGNQTTKCATGLEAGTYQVIVIDANGCQKIASDDLTQPTSPLTLLESHQNISCNGEADGIISVSRSGGTEPAEILWDDFAITWTRGALPMGDYGATVTDANGCQEYISVTLTEPPAIIIDPDPVDYTDVTGCPGDANGTITISASGGIAPLQYSKDGGLNWQLSNDFTVDAGIYNPSVKDANDCEVAGIPVTILDGFGPQIDVIPFLDASCTGVDDGAISVSASSGTSPYQYSIDCGDNWRSDSLFAGLAPGTYYIQVKDAGGCVTQPCTPVTITAGAGVQIDVDPVTSSCVIDMGPIGGDPPYLFSIDGGATFDTIRIYTIADGLVDGTYDLFVIDGNGCRDSMSVSVTNCKPPKPCLPWEAFTPNGDGANDVWNLYCPNYPDMMVRIFNTWGNLVFESAVGYPEPWDGTGKNGKDLPAGTYFYVIDWGDGHDPTSGTVNIIK